MQSLTNSCYFHRFENVVVPSLFSFFSCSSQISRIFFQLEHLALCCSSRCSWRVSSSFAYVFLPLHVGRSFQLIVEWLHFRCRMQYFLVRRKASVGSSLDSTTLESESSLFLFLWDFLDLLEADEDFFYLPWAPSFLLWFQRNQSFLWWWNQYNWNLVQSSYFSMWLA